jgi:hypothetical protein
LISLGLVIASLVIGVVGYNLFEGFSWVDSFLNAAMLLGGMGPLGTLDTDAGKVFAGLYALYCGLIELVAIGILPPLSYTGFYIIFIWKAHILPKSNLDVG